MCLSDDRALAEQGPALRKVFKTCSKNHSIKPTIHVYDSSFIQCLLETALGCTISLLTTLFSLHFPHMLTPTAAKAIYLPAFWTYDPLESHFDNSVWTYGTDYFLMVVMLYLVYSLLYHNPTRNPDAISLKRRAAGLLLCYAVSVTAGGVAHQHFLTLESRNSSCFRCLWTLCVGTVTLAGGFMGACGSQVARTYQSGYTVPDWFWVGFGGCTTAVCVYGFMSFQRPAADIFVAGITQFVPTFYLCGLSLLSLVHRVVPAYRLLCVVGFSMNAPLLPMYALLLQYTNWSLAQVNTLLHCWLCVTWTIQGLALQHYAKTAAAKKE